MRRQLTVSTQTSIQLKDITGDVQRVVQEAGIDDGVCLLFCPHTTAGLTINENADPDVASDLERAFREMVPKIRFDHAEGNSPAHFLSCVIGSSLQLMVENSRLQLGRWQGIYFCEFDGPRNRHVWIKLLRN